MDPFTRENGILTHRHSLRRAVALEVHKEVITHTFTIGPIMPETILDSVVK